MTKILHIQNLDCPVCAEALQSDIRKIKGVSSATVEYVTQTITVDVEQEEVLKKVIKTANAFEDVKVLDGGMVELNEESHRKEWLQIGLSALLFLVGIVLSSVEGKVGVWLSYSFFAAAYLLVGYPVLLSTAKNVVKGRIFDENFLMTVASVGAVALGEAGEGVAVMLLYRLGELLQAIAVGSSRKSVARLMELKSEYANLLVDGEQKQVSPESLRVGDIVLVKAGEKAPTDGVLRSESATLDAKSLTGEAELKRVERDGEILSGCINAGGMYEMKVTCPYQDSAVGRILEMVENASAGKAAPEKFISKFAKYYTPVFCALALVLALFIPLLLGLALDGRAYFYDFSRWANSALTFLVVSCPCALVISVPLTYFSGIGACARRGILVKGATYLDALALAKIFAFDKTGTLTEGSFSIRSARAAEPFTEQELLSLAAAVEQGSSHPIAKAFAGIKSGRTAERVVEESGFGVRASVDGREVLVGNAKLLKAHGVSVTELDSGYTLVYVAEEGAYVGVIEIGDALRKEAKACLRELQALGVTHTVMLTGDSEIRAKSIANEVGMYEVNAELLPDDKLKRVQELQKLGSLVYVGDGVNDAPVMTAADCSVSMGKLGSAAAVEASDLVLVSDDLRALPRAVRIARKTRSVVMQNVIFSIAMKAAFMTLGALGVLPLWLAVFADVGVMLLAVANSFRVRNYRINS